MYTDEDLNLAVDKGVFTTSSVDAFRHLVSAERNTSSVDEENFRLIGGFNDIFVVIACVLLLASARWVVEFVTHSSIAGYGVMALLSWGLSEFFVLRRKMALPAIVLLISFIGAIFYAVLSQFTPGANMAYVVAAAMSFLAAGLHWIRFKVPITIAAGTAALIGLFVALLVSVFPQIHVWILFAVFVCGLCAFSFAMYWDSTDIQRTTRNSDVAFWLHLLSAPLVIHPIFSSFGILDGSESLLGLAFVLFLYLLMSLISIAIDRRAFMVSSLIYVLYAVSSIIENYGGVGYSFAITGVLMGGVLLLVSALWQQIRQALIKRLPAAFTAYLPQVTVNR